MKRPPWEGDDAALIIVDWSWWLNKSFHLFGTDGMMSNVVGWFCAMLAYNPAHVAIALDSPGPTHRHKISHPTEPNWRYKGKRPPKPEEFYAVSERCIQIAELHSVPVLWAAEREADDVMATATAKARSAGYRVYLCTADKDLCGLVESDKCGNDSVLTWDNFTGLVRGPKEVREQFGVEPAQIADYLAIAGDGVDAVPGVPGLGGDKASKILAQFRTLAEALAVQPWPSEQHVAVEAEIKRMGKNAKINADVAAERSRIMLARSVAKWHAMLHENAELALFSRSLTSLDCDAGIAMQWDNLPVGGFQTEALREAYLSFGFTAKAREVAEFPKRNPWCIPYCST